MSGNNMESLLMGDDDSSSGESDDEVQVNVPTGGTAASAVAAMPAPVAPAPPPAPTPSPAPAPAAGGGNSQSDQIARLKSLYQMQPKRSTTPSSGASTPQTTNRSSPAPPQPPQQQQQPPPMQQLPPQQQRYQAPTPSGMRPLMPNRQHDLPQHPQQQQQQQQLQHQNHGQPSPHQPIPQQQQQQQQPQYHPQQQQHARQSSSSQYPSSLASRGSSSQPVASSGVPDPFAPTPLNRIKEREQQKMEYQQQRPQQPLKVIPQQQPPQQPPPQYHRPQQPPPQQHQVHASSSRPGGSSAPPGGMSAAERADRERELRRQKEKFLMYTRVLIKYLEQKDPNLHTRAKNIIKDCAEKNKRKVPGYESVTAAMKKDLKALVGDVYWKRAEQYLEHFLERKKIGGSSSSNNNNNNNPNPSASASASRPAAIQGGSTSNSAPRPPQQQEQQQEQLQRAEQEKQRKIQQEKAAKAKQQQAQQKTQQAGASSSNGPASTLQQMQREIASQKAKISGGKGSGGGKAASVGKKQVKRKSTTGSSGRKSGPSATSSSTASTTPTAAAAPAAQKSTAPAAAAIVAAATEPPDPETLPPREYNELMELVDHALDYDWTTAGLLLGSSKADLQLTDEQHKLLYGDSSPEEVLRPEDPSPETHGPRPGWGNRNVVSARAAWAVVRLREHKTQRPQQQQAPVVGDVGLTLPQTPGSPHGTTSVKSSAETTPAEDTTWVNEEKAEQDVVLAMLSEGAEIYLKGILEKAILCARQRQNLDGIRLWHQQFTMNKNKKDSSSSNNNSADTNGKNENGKDEKHEKKYEHKPALSLRLGCDVERQQAQAAGNAAMTVKRMEEALYRQSGVPTRARVLQGETLEDATCMADLALRPQLAKGADTADYHGKRRFEIYGGKDATEPPLGRVPKKAKLEVVDFLMGSHVEEPIGRHRASNASASIYF